MNRTGRHLLVALVTLAAGAGGTAVAADLITGADVKDGSLQAKDLSKKARKALKGQRGRRGTRGPIGPAGQPGPPGPPLQANDPAQALVGSGELTGDASFIRIGADGTGIDEPEFQVPAPLGGNPVASYLRVQLTSPAGVERRFALRLNGADTGLACVVPAAEDRCYVQAEVQLPADGVLSLRHTASGASNVRASFAVTIYDRR